MNDPQPLPRTDAEATPDAFTLSRHGDVMVIVGSNVLEHIDPFLLEGASTILLDAVKQSPTTQIIFDLGELNHFGSTFLALLVRCSKLATQKGGIMVLARVSEQARFLLHITALDMVWPFYDSVREAIDALESE